MALHSRPPPLTQKTARNESQRRFGAASWQDGEIALAWRGVRVTIF
jgi:hypothetical protein